jgi:hypothetical protein
MMTRLKTRGMLLLTAISLSLPTLGAENKAFINILAPADGAKFSVQGTNKLSYEAATGASKGNHVHVYVDGKEVGTLHHLKGDYTFKKLALGTHKVCVKVANRAHVPIGVERCVQVAVE